MRQISIRKIKPIGITLAIMLLVGLTFLAWSTYRKSNPKAVMVNNQPDTLVINTIDTNRLEKFKMVYQHIDVSKNEFLLKGTLNATDGADSTEKINHVTYIFSRKGNRYYFKLGEIEVFNDKERAVYVDHKNKKVMLGINKQVVPATMIPNLNKLITSVIAEGYIIKGTTTTNVETISLINPYHVTCKEYRLAFNPATLQPKQLHLRLSNAEEPENKQMDKIIDLYLSQTSDRSGIDQFLANKIVTKQNNTWQLSTAYRTYELINTL